MAAAAPMTRSNGAHCDSTWDPVCLLFLFLCFHQNPSFVVYSISPHVILRPSTTVRVWRHRVGHRPFVVEEEDEDTTFGSKTDSLAQIDSPPQPPTWYRYGRILPVARLWMFCLSREMDAPPRSLTAPCPSAPSFPFLACFSLSLFFSFAALLTAFMCILIA